MKQLLNQPLTPPSSDNVLSSSGSEGNYSPETEPVASMFQFQLNDLYDLNLFDQAPPQESIDASNLFYLNHAVMPDWDIHQVLGEKARPITSEEDGREAARNLIYEYPLLAPALMSIVVRHTLSLEYVTSIAQEFSESLKQQQASEENLKKKEMMKIEPAKPCEKKKEEPFTEQEFSRIVYKYYLHLYLLLRARGGSHEEVMAKFKDSYYNSPTCFKKYKETLAKKNQAKFSTQCKSSRKQQCNSSSNQCKASTSISASSSTNSCSKKSAQSNVSNQINSSKLSTLHTYCKVASTLLRNPSRMAHVNKVLRKEISFKPNKYTARIEDNYASMIGPFKNLRIANSS